MFATWRVDAPWQPITKKSLGMRMGGGKAAIDHYATPVKAGKNIYFQIYNIVLGFLTYLIIFIRLV